MLGCCKPQLNRAFPFSLPVHRVLCALNQYGAPSRSAAAGCYCIISNTIIKAETPPTTNHAPNHDDCGRLPDLSDADLGVVAGAAVSTSTDFISWVSFEDVGAKDGLKYVGATVGADDGDSDGGPM
mmetsp:Transcript_3483/g.9251  ORF Transcript_3483/g.9251 Transcript_3483/m.9251 type:complete len:126 (-) Transcript_3483:590-967(-)